MLTFFSVIGVLLEIWEWCCPGRNIRTKFICCLVSKFVEIGFLFLDDRFPDNGKIELVFSATPEKIQGR